MKNEVQNSDSILWKDVSSTQSHPPEDAKIKLHARSFRDHPDELHPSLL